MSRARYRGGQLAVESLLRSVGVHRCEQDLPGTELLTARGPLDGIETFLIATTSRVDIPATCFVSLCVDSQHHRLCAEFAAQLGDEFGTPNGSSIDAHLFSTREQDLARIRDIPDAAADRQRNEHPTRRASHHAGHDVSGIAGRRDVQKNKLVGTLVVVALGEFHRIAGIAQVDEVDSLDHAAAGHIETGDDSLA